MNGVKRDSSNSSAGGAVSVAMSTDDVDYEVTEIHPMIGDNKTEDSHDTGEKDSAETDNSGLPLDGGWAWMVLLGRYITLCVPETHSKNIQP